jgi:hypothetical protein
MYRVVCSLEGWEDPGEEKVMARISEGIPLSIDDWEDHVDVVYSDGDPPSVEITSDKGESWCALVAVALVGPGVPITVEEFTPERPRVVYHMSWEGGGTGRATICAPKTLLGASLSFPTRSFEGGLLASRDESLDEALVRAFVRWAEDYHLACGQDPRFACPDDDRTARGVGGEAFLTAMYGQRRRSPLPASEVWHHGVSNDKLRRYLVALLINPDGDGDGDLSLPTAVDSLMEAGPSRIRQVFEADRNELVNMCESLNGDCSDVPEYIRQRVVGWLDHANL